MATLAFCALPALALVAATSPQLDPRFRIPVIPFLLLLAACRGKKVSGTFFPALRPQTVDERGNGEDKGEEPADDSGGRHAAPGLGRRGPPNATVRHRPEDNRQYLREDKHSARKPQQPHHE
jgi:hypothetical protein